MYEQQDGKNILEVGGMDLNMNAQYRQIPVALNYVSYWLRVQKMNVYERME